MVKSAITYKAAAGSFPALDSPSVFHTTFTGSLSKYTHRVADCDSDHEVSDRVVSRLYFADTGKRKSTGLY